MLKIMKTDQRTEETLKTIARIAIANNRRSRFIGFASTSRGVEKWLKDLDHFENYIDKRGAISFRDNRQVHGFLNSKFSMNEVGFAFSTQNEYRKGKFEKIDVIIGDLLGSGNGSFILINKCKTFCLYLGEDVRSNFVWMWKV